MSTFSITHTSVMFWFGTVQKCTNLADLEKCCRISLPLKNRLRYIREQVWSSDKFAVWLRRILGCIVVVLFVTEGRRKPAVHPEAQLALHRTVGTRLSLHACLHVAHCCTWSTHLNIILYMIEPWSTDPFRASKRDSSSSWCARTLPRSPSFAFVATLESMFDFPAAVLLSGWTGFGSFDLWSSLSFPSRSQTLIRILQNMCIILI